MSLIGIDVGTSAVKAAAYRDDGFFLASSRAAATPLLPQPGQWELAPDEVWSATLEALQDLINRPKLCADPPRAIAISASGDEVFPVNAAGEPLGNCILSGDVRGGELESEIVAWETDTNWYAKCGHVPERMDPALRCLWWIRHSPQVSEQARYFLDWHSFLTLRLCDVPVTDHSLAAKSLLYDMQASDWSSDRAHRLGIDPARLPQIQRWGTVIGSMTHSLRQQLGLPHDVLIGVGGFDSSCAALGAGASTPGTVGLACGSWEVVVAPVDALDVSPPLVNSRFPVVGHPGQADQAVLAQSPNGTSVIDWSTQLLNADLIALSDEIQAGSAAPSHVLAIPHLSGAISPWAEGRDSRAALLGMTLSTSPADILKALMESIAFDLVLTLELLAQTKISCRVLRAAGGGTRSPWWMQLKSDLTGTLLEVVEQPEPGTFGAALLAGSALGVFESAGAAAEALANIEHRYTPDSTRAGRYQDRLATYRDAVPPLIAINRRLADDA